MATTNGTQATLNPPLEGFTRRRDPGPSIYRWQESPDFVPIPNLVQLQLESYQWFLTDGLRELFRSFSPVEDFTGTLSLEFLDSSLGEPKYSLKECREREVTYEKSLRVRVMLVRKDTGDIRESEVYLGELPMMTPRGTFIINGAERVVVSQLSRSPGVYFKDNIDNAGRTLFSAQVIPSEGAWIEFDIGSTNVVAVKIGQTKKFPATTLLRAFHYFEEAEPKKSEASAVEPATAAELAGRSLAERVVNLLTGEIVCEVGQTVDEALAGKLIADKNLSPIRVVEARRPCATTRDLILIFGRQTKLHQPLRLAEPLLSAKELEDFAGEVGEAVDHGFLQRLDQWRAIQRTPPARLMVTVRRGERGKKVEMSLADLRKEVSENPPLTRDNLIGKRLAVNLQFEGEAAPVVRAFEKVTPNIADLILENDVKELLAIELDEAIERTFEDDAAPVQKRLEDYLKRLRSRSSRDGTEIVRKFSDAVRLLGADEQTDIRAALAAAVEKVVQKDHVATAGELTEAERAILEVGVLEVVYSTLRPGDPPSVESGRSLLRSMFFDSRRYDLARVGRHKINRKLWVWDRLGSDVPLDVRWLTKHDLIGILNYLIGLRNPGDPQRILDTPEGAAFKKALKGVESIADLYTVDDIDNLENKRVRAVGELLQNQLRLGFLRMERVARERMTSSDPDTVTAQNIIYGRLCPIMTPEGPNIGLISALAIFARLNEFGFLETPYRRVESGKPTDDLVFLTADEEVEQSLKTGRVPTIAAARDWDEPASAWIADRITCRRRTDFPTVNPAEVDLIDVSPKQIFSAATALIPFLENDDANRALMGSNMQRQAVPLVRTESPWVGTGIERQVAVDSGAVVCAGRDGVVTLLDARQIVITGYDGSSEKHELLSFERTNQATFMNQRPLVQLGQHVRGPRNEAGDPIQIGPYEQLPDGARSGDPIADGSCTDHGRLALGKNVVTAFMSWEGYNYEDAIILSDRMVKDDVYTSIHIDKYEIQARDTKLGPEEITADIPNISDELRNNLDERGIIKIGTVVRPEDILVGKVAPKGQSEMTAEEKLVIAIFGKKAEEMRDTSLRVPHGAKGKVVAVRVFSRFKHRCGNPSCKHLHEFSKSAELSICEQCGGREIHREPQDDLPAGVNQLVRVYVAQRRKIMEGDKMAGRHGNKGVISKILPIEDMPFLPDGTPVDVILNPLGVPSRMNIGQILETHLGWVAYHRGHSFETPVFASIPEAKIFDWLQEVYNDQREAVLRDYIRTELPIWGGEPPADEASDVLLDKITSQLQHLDEADVLIEAERLGLDADALVDLKPAKRLAAVRERVVANAAKRVGFDPSAGKMVLRDGRTGEAFDRDVMVGVMYVMKLSHLVDDKIHARSTGPYSLVTQQPLGGKAQFGGQRFGEMEVWALEAYGSAHSLQEVLTIKSDDVHGRVKAYESIVKGENIQDPGIPESFKILIKELQSLGLEVTVESKEGRAVDLNEQDD